MTLNRSSAQDYLKTLFCSIGLIPKLEKNYLPAARLRRDRFSKINNKISPQLLINMTKRMAGDLKISLLMKTMTLRTKKTTMIKNRTTASAILSARKSSIHW